MSELSLSIFSGGNEAVSLGIKLLGMMCLWCGIMNIAEKSGLCSFVSMLLSPLLNVLFPSLKKDVKSKNAIAMNMTANLLGMGNAATPLGLAAMERMQELNRDKSRPSREMMTFIVINTAALRIIPSTVASLRQTAGSENPMDIIFCVWISSALSMIAAVTAVKIFGKLIK